MHNDDVIDNVQRSNTSSAASYTVLEFSLPLHVLYM